MEVLYLVFTVFALIIIYVIWKPRSREGRPIPGPRGWPFLGMFLEVTPENMYSVATEYARVYGEIVQIKLLGKTFILLNSERMIRKAFAEDPAKLSLNDRPNLHVIKHFLHNGTSIVAQPHAFSKEHNLLRKEFTRGFHVYGDGVKDFEEKVQAGIRNLLDDIEGFNGEEFDVLGVIKRSIINLISIFLQGCPLSAEKENIVWDYQEALRLIVTPRIDTGLTIFPFLRHLPGVYGKVHNEFKRCHEAVMEEFLYKQRNTRDKSKSRGIVDYLLDLQENEEEDKTGVFTDECVEGVVSDIAIAGILTTTASLASMILCLANHPEVQRKAQQEIQKVIGNDRLPEVQDKANCPYMEAIFMESQRYISVNVLGAPHISRENVNLDGFHIEKGSLIFANYWYIQHDEKIWGDPWTFRPERFLDDQEQLLPRSHTYFKNVLPFGIGRRQCVGEVFARSRIFLYITALLQRWTFIPSRDRCGSCDPRSDQFQIRANAMPFPFFCCVKKNTTV